LETSQQFSFYRVGLLAPRPTPIPEDQVSVFISPRGIFIYNYPADCVADAVDKAVLYKKVMDVDLNLEQLLLPDM
jgi:hypothetical protein